MVRKLNHRFKNTLTINTAFGCVVMAGSNSAYGDKMQFSVHF